MTIAVSRIRDDSCTSRIKFVMIGVSLIPDDNDTNHNWGLLLTNISKDESNM